MRTKQAIPINGWLYLVAVFLAYNFAVICINAGMLFWTISAGSFNNFLNNIFFMINYVVPIILLVLCIPTFCLKKRIFVYLFGFYLVFEIIVYAYYLYMFNEKVLPNIIDNYNSGLNFTLSRIVIFIAVSAVILIYMIFSKRVKDTFVR